MNATVAQLTARSLLGRRRALLLVVLPALLLLLAAVARGVAGVDETVTSLVLGGFTLGTVVPLLGLIIGTGAIGPEIDDGSIVYLLAKPLDRFAIAATKVAVAVATILVVAALPTLLAGLILTGSVGGTAAAYALGAAVAGTAYCALFHLLAVLTRNAVIVGLAYAVIWESLIGGYVPGAQALSIQQWALTITERLLGGDAARLGATSAVGLGTGVALLLLVTVGGTWYAGARLRTLPATAEA